jgi:hypothetical protein
MNKETYKKAHELQEKIAKLKYELEVLKQSYEKPTSIRFGTEYNVSIPITFNQVVYEDALRVQIGDHKSWIALFEQQFYDL